jgi:hypothetical protein
VHKIEFIGFNLKMIKHLDNYMAWTKARKTFDIIKEVQFVVQIEICADPNHLEYPGMIIFCHIDHIRIYFYDYIMINILQIQDYIMKTLQGQPYEGIYVDDSRTTDSRDSAEERSVLDFGSRTDLQYSESSDRLSSLSRERSLIYSDHDESQSLNRKELNKKDDFNPFTKIKHQEELKEGGSAESNESEESEEDEFDDENRLTSYEQSYPISSEDSKTQNQDNSSGNLESETPQEKINESGSENVQSESDPSYEPTSDFKLITRLATNRNKF